MKITDIRALEDIAKEIRIKILKILAAGSVHTGGSLSAVDMDTLYTPGKINSFLQYHPFCESVPGTEISTLNLLQLIEGLPLEKTKRHIRHLRI